ncbi:PrpF domain-containing protein [Microbacterium aoyamense]|uniref:PrpF domain-containing protein n=1 Tax=Microbacterium aoyamense TaxID=344166 RepID=A0ABP5B4U7_9MICO|nr:PrpF domain-containing protein [Microbacterium aoyamense]
MKRSVHATLMRGGSSRGPVVEEAELPEPGAERDRVLIDLIGRGRSQLDGVGGGTPTTSKVVIVQPARGDPDVDIAYCVGNVVVGADTIDYAGTCGNMTSAVPLFAQEHDWPCARGARGYRLRNTSTGQIVETTFLGGSSSRDRGASARVRADYLDPAGSVFEALLPTGSPADDLILDGRPVRVSIVDATHPYVFVRYRDVVVTEGIDSEASAAIERLRAAACVRLGVVDVAPDASRSSPAVPRIVLLEDAAPPGELRVLAVSMGAVIGSVPVTAAMCAAAAAEVAGTLVNEVVVHGADGSLTVRGKTSDVIATATFADGALVSVGVERTARTIADAHIWLG